MKSPFVQFPFLVVWRGVAAGRFSFTATSLPSAYLSRALLAALLGACACVMPVRAAEVGEDHIDTDGPDYVESTESVSRGRFQFETGPQVEHDRRDGARLRTSTTPLLLKAGLGDGWEARLETEGITRVSGSDAGGAPASLRGTADTAIGLKWHVHDGDESGTPALAWIAHLEGATGSGNLRGRGVRPSLRAVIGWDLPHDFGIGLMPGVKYDASSEDGHRYWSGILGVVAGKWWTPRVRTFVESENDQIARAKNGGNVRFNNVGAAYLLGNDWQIGGRMGWAANRNTPTRYWMVSLAGRF